MKDIYNTEGEADTNSIYGGAAMDYLSFQHFLKPVAFYPGLLPLWWVPQEEGLPGAWVLPAKNASQSTLWTVPGQSALRYTIKTRSPKVAGNASQKKTKLVARAPGIANREDGYSEALLK